MASMVKPGSPSRPFSQVCLGMNAAIRIVYTGKRALQLMSGATRMVVSRSRRFSITRAAMMPGMAQANDDSSGMNDLPLSPTRAISLSIRYAARAM